MNTPAPSSDITRAWGVDVEATAGQFALGCTRLGVASDRHCNHIIADRILELRLATRQHACKRDGFFTEAACDRAACRLFA